MPPETALTTRILKSLRTHGAKVEKIRGSAFTTKGTPDILGSYRGRALALEVKRPDPKDDPPYFYVNVETDKQHLELQAWQVAGALVGVVRSVNEAVQLVTDPQPRPVQAGTKEGATAAGRYGGREPAQGITSETMEKIQNLCKTSRSWIFTKRLKSSFPNP